MIICGAETPLQANPYIPMLDEATGETEFCLTWTTPKGLDPDNIAARTLFQNYAIKTLQKLRGEGWNIYAEEQFPESGVVIVTRPVEAMELKGITPESVPQILRGRTAVIIGTEGSAEEIYSTEMGKTLRVTAHRGCYMPSEQFLDGLVNSNASFTYNLRDSTERFGLVMITPAVLPLNGLLEDRIISLVWKGDEAYKAWNRSLSWQPENRTLSRG